MKNLNEFITESLSGFITEASADFTRFIKNLKHETQEPKNPEEYIKFEASDAHFFNTADAWVKVSDLDKYTDQLGLMSVAYNLMKTINPKITIVDILYWNGKEWGSFATASLNKSNRFWHPEWIKSDKYNFK